MMDIGFSPYFLIDEKILDKYEKSKYIYILYIHPSISLGEIRKRRNKRLRDSTSCIMFMLAGGKMLSWQCKVM